MQHTNDREAPQGLTKGRAASPELNAQFALGRKSLAWLQIATLDQAHDLLNDLIAYARLSDRPNLRTGGRFPRLHVLHDRSDSVDNLSHNIPLLAQRHRHPEAYDSKPRM
jgi:hypothetical protein